MVRMVRANFRYSVAIFLAGMLVIAHFPVHARSTSQTHTHSALSWFEPLDRSATGSWIARNPHTFAQLSGQTVSIQPRSEKPETNTPPVHISFLNASSEARLKSKRALNSKSHYIPGSEQQHWRHVDHHAHLRAQQIYSGIDVEYYFRDSSLEFDFIVAAKADPDDIGLQFADSQKLSLADDGALLIKNNVNELLYRIESPYAYQTIGNTTNTVDASFSLKQNTVKIITGSYDHNHPLIIDPVITLNTYLGGSGNDDGFGIGTDAQNNIYITGLTDSADFPLQSPWQGNFSGTNSLFVAKIQPGTPATLDYATFVGTDVAEIRDIVIDNNGQASVTGSTSSLTHPLLNPLQASHGGLIDTYITQLSADGSGLVFSTYFGGISVDRGRGINIDNQGNIIVTGPTSSFDLPLLNAAQSSLQGVIDAYLVKISADGQTLLFSTYLGGNGYDYGKDITTDAGNNIHVAAHTYSNDLATLNALQDFSGGGIDFMLASYSPTGQLQQLSYYGGSADDFAHGITTNSQGDIVVAGYTRSADFPLSMDAPRNFAGDADGALLTYTPMTTAVKTSHLYGGTGYDSFERINRNAGRIVATGTSQSTDWPVNNAIQANLSGFSDAVVIEFLDDGTELFASYIGGNGADNGLDVAISNNGSIHLTGATDSSNLGSANAVQMQLAGGRDAYIISLARDTDADGFPDSTDNCPNVFNPDQSDSNENGIGDVCEPPAITGIWPGDGPTNTIVFVFGSNFVPFQSQVSVNGIASFAVQVVSDDMLLFVLPAGNTNGPVTVTTPHGTTASTTNFGQPLTGLSITGIWKNEVKVQDFVFVFGSDYVPGQTQVSMGGINAQVQVVSENMLIFIVPVGATTGPVTVTIPSDTVTSDTNLTILP